jgi:hypothetical protein
MGLRSFIAGVGAVALLSVMAVSPVSAGGGTATRWVDDDGRAGPTGCSGARRARTSIQDAVNASDTNDVIKVCPGTYTGRVRITGARDGLKLSAVAKWDARIVAPARLTEGGLIRIYGVDGVSVRGFLVEFPTSGCRPRTGDVAGITVRNADQSQVRANRIRSRGANTIGACGYEDGITVASSTNVRVAENAIQDFTEDGVRFTDGSTGRIEANSIHYYHAKEASSTIAGIGIQVRGSTALVARNGVRSLSTGGSPHLQTAVFLLEEGGSTVRDNRLRWVRFGVDIHTSGAEVHDNELVGHVGTGRGIHVWAAGTDNVIRDLRISGFDIGIELDGTGNTFTGNNATGSVTQGCFDHSTGSGTAGTGNTWTGNVGSPPSTPAAICP